MKLAARVRFLESAMRPLPCASPEVFGRSRMLASCARRGAGAGHRGRLAQREDYSASYLNETLTLARYWTGLPSSIWMSSLSTSAMRRSRREPAARWTAADAAFSHDSVLVPTSSMTLYTLSAMVASSLARDGHTRRVPHRKPAGTGAREVTDQKPSSARSCATCRPSERIFPAWSGARPRAAAPPGGGCRACPPAGVNRIPVGPPVGLAVDAARVGRRRRAMSSSRSSHALELMHV